jgi:hypothetical protein
MFAYASFAAYIAAAASGDTPIRRPSTGRIPLGEATTTLEVRTMNTTATESEREARASTETVPVRTGDGDTVLRTEAIARLKRKRKFAEDAVAYISVNGVLWVIWTLGDRSSDGSMPWPAWVSAIWGFFLAIDAWRAYGRWPASMHRPISEAEIEQEMKKVREA